MAYKSMLRYSIVLGSVDDDIGCDDEEVQLERTLIEAAANGNYDEVVNLLNSGVTVDAVKYNKLLFYASKNYVTPLQVAAANGHDKVVQILIDHDANVDAKDRFDNAALHMAAEKGHYLCVKALLEGDADCSPPTKFSKLGCYKAVPHLGGTTPLHLAAANNHIDCVKELIQYGADYNAVDERGHTSLYIAAKNGFSECVLTHLKNAMGREILSLPSYDTSDTPLHFAVSQGSFECVRELLHRGSDVNHLNRRGYSPLHIALSPSNENIADQLELVKLLVLEGYNTDINCPDGRGFTPLHYCGFNSTLRNWLRRPEYAKFLISHGANVNIRSTLGVSLLECELRYNGKHSDVLKYVVRSMLQLPLLNSLNLYPNDSQADAEEQIARARALTLMNEQDAENLQDDSEEEITEMRIIVSQNENMEIISHDMHAVLPLNSPIAPMLPTATAEGLRLLRRGISVAQRQPANGDVEITFYRTRPSSYKKQKWYDILTSNPRTLQHHCRHAIRSYMGPKKMKQIKRLPVPDALQSFLMLESKE